MKAQFCIEAESVFKLIILTEENIKQEKDDIKPPTGKLEL
jgi:hypothetical protein